MSDTVKLIIEMPEQAYKLCKTLKSDNDDGIIGICAINAIANGTPLPKGHGRILDEKDILDTENNDGGYYDLVDMPEYIAGVKAIIESEEQIDEH